MVLIQSSNNHSLCLEIALEFLDDEVEEGSDGEESSKQHLESKRNNNEKADNQLETPPGLNLFPPNQSEQNGFKHFNLGKKKTILIFVERDETLKCFFFNLYFFIVKLVRIYRIAFINV